MNNNLRWLFLFAAMALHVAHGIIPSPGTVLLMGITSAGVTRWAPEWGIVATGWPSSRNPDPAKYFQFVVAPEPGYSVSVSYFFLPQIASGFNDPPGVEALAFRSDRDAFTQNLNYYTSTWYNWTGYYGMEGFNQLGTITSEAPVTLRLYPHASGSPEAWFGFSPETGVFDSIRIFGTLVPEPSAICFAPIFGLIWIARRFVPGKKNI